MNSINCVSSNKCYGCGVCSAVCPKKAVSMRFGEDGFMYPLLDASVCVNCGICKRHCPALDNSSCSSVRLAEPFLFRPSARKIPSDCSSGGFVSLFCEFLLEKGAVVYASASDGKGLREVKRITDARSLEAIHGSFYVQSRFSFETLPMLKADLDEGRLVVFVGTPCQVYSVKKYLMGDRANLLTIDLVCHGVASPALFESYLAKLEKKCECSFSNVIFRSALLGKYPYNKGLVCFSGQEVKYAKKVKNDSFCTSYFKNDILRESCYTCRFSSMNRVSDITVGDYNQFSQEEKRFRDGCTLVCLNTQKANDIISPLSIGLFDYVKVDHYRPQPNLIGPSKRPSYRGRLKGYSKDKFDSYRYRYSLLDYIKSIIPDSIKEKIKKV